MIDKLTIAHLRLVHGSYNAAIMLLFFYQGFIGLRIRRERMLDTRSFGIIKRHRRLGPVLSALGIFGYLAGLTLVYLDYGYLLKYPLHFIAGSAIVFSIAAAFLISRKIAGAESPWRTPHRICGILVMGIYPIQAFLGLGIFF